MNHVAIAPSKGIRVQVTRMSQDCTNNGISATHEVLTVVAIKARGREHKCSELAERYRIDAPTKDAPAVAMEVFKFSGHDRIYLSLKPLELDDFSWVPLTRQGHHTPMAGGNTAASADPLWRQLVKGTGADSIDVAIHDRFESFEDYAAMI